MGKWRHYKESKEYRNLQIKECPKCRHHGRDVKIRGKLGMLCNNCRGRM